jgi:hypothetical protein
MDIYKLKKLLKTQELCIVENTDKISNHFVKHLLVLWDLGTLVKQEK